MIIPDENVLVAMGLMVVGIGVSGAFALWVLKHLMCWLVKLLADLYGNFFSVISWKINYKLLEQELIKERRINELSKKDNPKQQSKDK